MQRNVSKSSTLVRGGQTTQHWWRMALQVMRFASVVAASVYVITFGYLALKDHTWAETRIAIYYELAERGIMAQSGFAKDYAFTTPEGGRVTMSAVDLYRNTQYRQLRDRFFQAFHSASYIALLPAMLSGLLSFIVFQITGTKIQDDEHIRGTRLVEAGQLRNWSKNRWRQYRKEFKDRKKAPVYTIAGIPFPPNALEAQTGLFGTVGVGKTNAIVEMLGTVRALGGRAVVYDRMGTFVQKFYDEETDVILNPFDDRSHSWCVFDDVHDVASFTQIAEVMIPAKANATGDPFWSQAARLVFEYAARTLYKDGPRTNTALRDAILTLPAEKLGELISSTPGAHFFNESIEKTSQSIRANLIAEMRLLEFMRSDGPRFSVRDWMKSDEPSILFLTGDAEHAAATRNLISVVLEIGANALMAGPKSTDPRVFFFMDEVPTLNRLPFLVSSLAEIRQFGGAFVLGYQVYSQLEEIYGKEAAQSITGTINNRIVFNTPDFRTAKLFSESLGSEDLLEKRANITVGAHEARDGVGFMQNRVERPIVTPSEIQALGQFKAYIRFAYDAPTALIEFPIVNVPDKADPFLEYLGSGFDDVFGRAEEKPKGLQRPIDHKEQTQVFDDYVAWCLQNFSIARADWMDKRTAPPADIAVHWDHYARQRAAGIASVKIVPFVDLSSYLMSNRPASGDAREEPDIPPPWARRKQPVGTIETGEDTPASQPATEPNPAASKTQKAGPMQEPGGNFSTAPRSSAVPKTPAQTSAEAGDLRAATPDEDWLLAGEDIV